MEDLQVLVPYIGAFVTTLLVLALPPILAYVWSKGAEAFAQAKADFTKQNPEAAYHLEQAATIGMYAAEQSGLAKALKQAGEQKLAWATETAQKYLDAVGFKGVDVDLIKSTIEAKVFTILNKSRHPEKVGE